MVCSKSTLYYQKYHSLCVVTKENNNVSVFNSADLHSALYFFYFQNFTSNPCPNLEPKIISNINKYLYELFDERKFGKNLDDCCNDLNNQIADNILELDKKRKFLHITFAFKKPVKDFSYNYKMKSSYEMTRIIQTLVTTEIEV